MTAKLWYVLGILTRDNWILILISLKQKTSTGTQWRFPI